MGCLAAAEPLIHLAPVDWSILLVYLAFIVGLGFYLKKYARTDDEFFLAGRKNSAWVAGVAFMSANMGAMEVIGYTSSAVKYGIHCAHFYLVGAVPAMLFLGLFMMPFYYSGRIKSIPGYLKERFDEKTRVLNAAL
ncbi:MAG TPA: Na+/galactose cotransporter, partial [Planctomycetes bacterium]|nr:Na+/galactose cotransporter [Planctomycetota bacterium]